MNQADADREQEHQRQRHGRRHPAADGGENPNVDAEAERVDSDAILADILERVPEPR